MKRWLVDVIATLAAGTFAGGQLMIGISFGAQWRGMTGNELVQHFPSDWIHIATTIIPFALLQTLFIPLALYFAWNKKTIRRLWGIALACWLINCAITSLYHFPVVWAAMNGGFSAVKMPAAIDQWVRVHWVRIVLGYATFLFAILATVRSYLSQPVKQRIATK